MNCSDCNSSLQNVVIVLSSTAGIGLVTGFTRDLQRWLDPADAYTLSDTDVAKMTRYLDRLDLQPRFPQMLVYLQGVANGTSQDAVAVNSAYHSLPFPTDRADEQPIRAYCSSSTSQRLCIRRISCTSPRRHPKPRMRILP